MSTISSVFKGYNAKRNALPRSERAVTKHKPNGRLGKVLTAVLQMREFDTQAFYEYHKYNTERQMENVAAIFGFRDMQYHYTKGWRVA